MVGVTWSAPSGGSHDGFSISIDGPGLSSRRDLASRDISETFESAQAGAVYTVKLKTKLQGLLSNEVSQTVTASE